MLFMGTLMGDNEKLKAFMGLRKIQKVLLPLWMVLCWF